MTLRDDVKQVEKAVSAQGSQSIPGSRIVFPMPARSYPNIPAAYEDGIAFDSQVMHLNNTSRPMWKTQPAALQQNKVNTLNMPTAVIASGIVISPTVTSTNLVAVPDTTVAIRGTAGTQIQIQWHFAGLLSTATATASLALFRDGVQLSPTAYGSSQSNGSKFSVAGSYIDSPSTGLHSYALYWATNAGTLTGDGKGRFINAMILKPQ